MHTNPACASPCMFFIPILLFCPLSRIHSFLIFVFNFVVRIYFGTYSHITLLEDVRVMAPKITKKSDVAASALHYEEQKLADDVTTLSLRLEALKRVYLGRMQEAAQEKQREIELRAVLSDRASKLKDREEERMDVLTDCTRQHKTDERSAIARIATLDAAVHRLHEEKAKMQREMEEKNAAYTRKINERKKEYDALIVKTDEMEKEFAVMLGDIENSMHPA